MFGQDKPDVFGVLSLGGESYKTSVVKNSVSASFDTWHVWLVEEAGGHVVEVTMYDRDQLTSDEFLGYAAVDVETMSQVSHQYNNNSNNINIKNTKNNNSRNNNNFKTSAVR